MRAGLRAVVYLAAWHIAFLVVMRLVDEQVETRLAGALIAAWCAALVVGVVWPMGVRAGALVFLGALAWRVDLGLLLSDPPTALTVGYLVSSVLVAVACCTPLMFARAVAALRSAASPSGLASSPPAP